MAPRGRAAAMSDDYDFDFDRSCPDSSPDPLNASVNDSMARGRRKSSRAAKQPLASTSPSKQNSKPSIAELDFLSPAKSMVMNTGRAQGASPWRIKVTVEAEPGTESENSPTVQHMTRTTTVPLKDADAASPVKRRGRPRKSETPGKPSKTPRSSTPKPRGRKPARRGSSAGATEASAADAADVDTDTVPKKRRGRPRKTVQPATEDDVTLVVDDKELPGLKHSPATNSAFATSEEPESVPMEIDEDAATPQPPAQLSVPTIETTGATPKDSQPRLENQPLDGASLVPSKAKGPKKRSWLDGEEPVAFTPPETDLSRKLRARRSTPAVKGALLPVDSSSDAESDSITPPATDEEGPAAAGPVLDPLLQSGTEDEDFEPFQAPDFDDDDDDDDDLGLQDATNFALDEGATRMPDDTTIIDSENFSMVSVDSLPSISALSSPPNGNAGTTPVARNLTSALEEDRLRVPPADIRKTRSSPRVTTKPSPRPLEPLVKASPTPVRRYITPTVDSHPLSNPPPIVPAHSSLSEVETPRIGRVVRAGVALQGVLDPERLTPQAGSSKQALDKKRDHLDDLFRGFSEGTRRDLQAGLRLGEQLAQQRQANAQSSPALSSPIKTNPSASVDDVFYPSIKNQKSRLPTPEDADYVSPSPPPPTHATEVHYPSLNVEQQAVHLVSPARSSTGSAAEAGHTPPIRAISAEGRRFMTVVNEQGQELRGAEILVVADEDEQAEDDYSDIWQEEASRSSDEPGIDQPAAPVGTERSPQLQDLFSDEGPVKPTRGKLPRTWRRKSSSDFHYSDEVEEPQQETPSSTESDHSPPTRMDKGKAKVVEPIPEEQSAEDEGDLSDASDDTGLFFQSNMPTLFNHRRSTEIRKKRAEKLDLSLLMQEGESLLLESSPPPAFKTPSAPTPNPFKNTPPRFAALHTSPAKSSPLRKEIWASESASDSFHQYQDESTLPLPASSPFHTYVEGDSMVSTASDQQQFRVEMEGGTDPSLRRLRNQADDYLDAYSLQDRTLNEIEEVTEPSRTLNKQTSMMNSSPSKTRERSVLEPKRTYAPLFSSETTTKNQKTAAQKRQSVGQAQKAAVVALPTEQPSSGIFGRLTSSLWSVLGNPTPPPSHPAIADFDRLPKVQPWTKTHYKTLDRLYQLHKKQPTLFAPSSASSTSNTNNSLLTQFFTGAQKPFLGAKYSSWGYSATMTEPLIVLCAVYMQLLTLSGVTEYEKLSGKEIEMGDCNPASWAKPIDHEEVVRRLASIVMGEDLRRDERRGKEIHRVGGLTIEWPH